MSAVYINMDGQIDRIPLKLSCPRDHSDYTLMIRDEVGKVSDIFKEYRLARKTLIITLLLKYCHSFSSRKDFLTFMANDIKERRKRNKIEPNTRNGHMVTPNKLEAFWKAEVAAKTKGKLSTVDTLPLPFSALTPKLLENFRAFLRNQYGSRSF